VFSELQHLYETFITEIHLRFPSRCSLAQEGTLSGSDFSWLYIHTPSKTLPPHGWKIHVSCSVTEIPKLIAQVLRPLLSVEQSFKLPRQLQGWFLLNSGGAGHTQLGKIITIYPSSDAEMRRLALFLRGAWPTCSGPRVLSDLPLNETGSISTRFGVFGRLNAVIDEEGRTQYELRLPGDITFLDRRSLSGDQAQLAPRPPISVFPPRTLSLPLIAEFLTTKYLLYGFKHHSPKSTLVHAIDLESEAHVVVKIANRGVAEDSSGLDSRARLKQEFDCLSALEGRLEWTARPLGYIQNDECAMLAMTHIHGHPVAMLPYDSRLRAWNRLAEAVETLHQLGVVHRDVKLDNALSLDGGAVSIVDFEFCQPIGSVVQGGAGTRGHRSPIAAGIVCTQEDQYALGASLFHAATDCTPATIPPPASRMLGLAKVCTSPQIANLIASKVKHNSFKAPPSVTISRESIPKTELSGYHSRLLPKAKHLTQEEEQWLLRAIVETLDATYEARTKVSDGCFWPGGFTTGHSGFQALNHGAAGILLALLSIAKKLPSRKAEDMIRDASEWLRKAPIHPRAAGLFSGNAGIALALCEAGRHLGDTRLTIAGLERLRVAAASVLHHDLFFGASGVLLAASKMSRLLNSEEPTDLAKHLTEQLEAAVCVERDVSFWPTVRDEAHTGPTFGAAHGTAGTALGLGVFSRLTGDLKLRRFADEAARSVYLFSRSRGLRYTPMGMDSVDVRRRSNEWCHGTGGYLWCVLQMPSALTPDEMRDLLDEFVDSPLMASPILCHGLAGQVDICRLALNFGYRVDCLRERIVRLLRTLRLMAQRKSGKIVWGGENPEYCGPGLLTGWLGPCVEIHLALHDNRNTLLG
jgi:serine/threonine protein kinase